MATTPDHEPKREESEYGLEKPSHANTGTSIEDDLDPNDDGTFVLDGKIYRMSETLKELPEIDYADSNVQKWIEEEENEVIRKYGKLTHEEFDHMHKRRQDLRKEHPSLSMEALNQIALREIRNPD